MTAPFDYLIVVFLSNSFYQNYLEPSFSISTEFGAESRSMYEMNIANISEHKKDMTVLS